jgi:hypothetical protein
MPSSQWRSRARSVGTRSGTGPPCPSTRNGAVSHLDGRAASASLPASRNRTRAPRLLGRWSTRVASTLSALNMWGISASGADPIALNCIPRIGSPWREPARWGGAEQAFRRGRQTADMLTVRASVRNDRLEERTKRTPTSPPLPQGGRAGHPHARTSRTSATSRALDGIEAQAPGESLGNPRALAHGYDSALRKTHGDVDYGFVIALSH